MQTMKRSLLLIALYSTIGVFNVIAQPANDNCWDVDPFILEADLGVVRTGNTEGATDALGFGFPNVWEAFTLTECLDVTISYCGTTPAFPNVHATMYTGCSQGGPANYARHPNTGFEQTTCSDGNITFQHLQLPAGTYFFLVDASTEGDYSITFTGTPCSATPPANDECAGAITLVPDVDCVTINADVNGANAGTSIPPITCEGWTGDPSDDVWFQFVATTTAVNISVFPSAQFDATVDLRSGSCGATQNIDCSEIGGDGGAEMVEASGLTIGETYYVRVYDWWAGLALTTTFDICIQTVSGVDCTADAGTLIGGGTEVCLIDGQAPVSAVPAGDAVVPDGYSTLYLLATSPGMVVLAWGEEPDFIVNMPGDHTLHTLVYDEATLDLGLFTPGTSTLTEIEAMLLQGGGSICGSITMASAVHTVIECDPCDALAGSVTAISPTACLVDSIASLLAIANDDAVIPAGYQRIFILVQGDGQVIIAADVAPEFEVGEEGSYLIHALVFDPATLNLSQIELGVSTVQEVNAMLQQGGGMICASLDMLGAEFNVIDCVPANDDCSFAQPLNIYELGNCTDTFTSGTTIFATSSGIDPICDPSTEGHADVWYIFNSGENDQVFIEITPGSITSWGVAVYNSCMGDGLVACEAEPSGSLLINTMPNTDYYVQVYTNLQSGQTGDFSICLTGLEEVNICLGGTVSTTTGDTTLVICTNFFNDPVTFVSAGIAAQNYSYVLTTEGDSVVAVLVGNTIDFADAPVGTYHIHGVSYNGELTAMEGTHISEITSDGDCISISSNHVVVLVEFCTSIAGYSSAGWNIFPNPATETVTIRHVGPAVDVTIQITDMQGRMILAENALINGPHTISLGNSIAPGIYNVAIIDPLGRSSHRLVVE